MKRDICQNRHKGNTESQMAFQEVQPHISRTKQRIMNIMKRRPVFGLTSKEVASHMGKALNEISGRISQLAADGRIERNGKRRDGCAVWVPVRR